MAYQTELTTLNKRYLPTIPNRQT